MVPATASVADSCCAIDSAPVEAVQPVPESGLDGESSCSPLSATASPYQCRSLGVTHCCRKLTAEKGNPCGWNDSVDRTVRDISAGAARSSGAAADRCAGLVPHSCHSPFLAMRCPVLPVR